MSEENAAAVEESKVVAEGEEAEVSENADAAETAEGGDAAAEGEGAEGDADADQEAQPEPEPEPEPEPKPLPVESVVVLIKPRVTATRGTTKITTVKAPEVEEGEEPAEPEVDEDGNPVVPAVEYETVEVKPVDEILSRIQAAGFSINTKKTVIWSKAQSREFFRGVSGTTEDNINYLCSGALLALEVSAPGGVAAMNALCGAVDPRDARAASAEEKDDRAKPLRALFGISALENAIHCSATTYDALWESSVAFPRPFRLERSLLVVGPGQDQSRTLPSVLAENGFVIVGERQVKLTHEEARELFGEDEARVTAHAGNVNTLLLVEGDSAISRLQLLVGPAEPRDVPVLLSRTVNNPLYASTSERAAADIARWFPDPLKPQRTFAMIKPNAVNNAQEILNIIAANGFTVIAQQRTTLSVERAEQFYAEHRGKFFFPRLTSFMSSGPVYLLVLSKPGAIAHWRLLCGPTNSNTARLDKPNSLRALYGDDGTANAVHGSDSVESAEREICFFFPAEVRHSGGSDGSAARLRAPAAKQFMQTAPSATDSARSLHSVLVEGLTELCRTKPDDINAIRSLGQWLLDNNPNAPRASNGGARGAAAADADADSSNDNVDDATPSAVQAVNGGAVVPLADTPPLNIVFLIGGPGSGRDVQARNIVRDFGYTRINTGDLLRAEIEGKTAIGEEAKAVIEAGELVATDVVLKLIKSKMRKEGGYKFLIDGFPRDLSQAFAFEQQVGPVHTVLYLESSRNRMIAHIMEDEDAENEEDLTEGAARRVDVFHERTTAVTDFYEKLGKVSKIHTDSLSVEETYTHVHEALCPNVVFIAGGLGGQRSAVAAHVGRQYPGWVSLSVDNLMRQEIASGSALGQEINDLIGEDRPIPTDIQVNLLDTAMDASPHDKFLVHDFPATLEEALAFEKVVGGPRFFLDLSGNDGNTDEATKEVLDFYQALGYVRQVDTSGGMRQALRTVGEHFEPDVRFVLGFPGSGKTSQCELAKEQGFTVLSTQDILFAEIQRGSEEGQRIHHMVEINQIIPISTHLGLIKKIVAAAGPRCKFLIDGFPKALDQARAFEEQVARVKEIIFLDCDADTALQRSLDASEENDGSANEYQISKNISRFSSQTELVINHYANLGLCRTVDASLSLDESSAQMRQALTPGVVFVAGPSAPARKAVSERLQAEFGYVRVCPDELVKAELQRPTPTGTLLSTLLRKRQIIPVDVTLQLVIHAIEASGSRRILVDNFPIAPDQLRAFEQSIGSPTFVLYLDSGSDADGVTQHLTATQPELSSSEIETAVTTFESLTRPIIEDFRAKGKVRTVNATLSADDMYNEAQRYFKPVLVPLIGSKFSQKNLVTTILGRQYGFTRIDVPGLQDAEASTQSKDGAIIQTCRAQSRTVPTDVTLRLVRRAILGSGNAKFLIDGFPQQVSAGYPLAHDQMFAIEDKLAPVAFAIHCSADAGTQGDLARSSVDVEEEADRFSREVQPVLDFVASSNTQVVAVDTSDSSPNSWGPLSDQIKEVPSNIFDILVDRASSD